MKYKKNTRLVSANGADIGDIKRLVIDPRTKQVTHLVVSGGILEEKEKLFPTTTIVREEENKVYLRDVHFEPDELMDFREEEYFITDEQEFLANADVDSIQAPSYYSYPTYPVVGTQHLGGAPNLPGDYAPDQENTVRQSEKQNIPEGTIALKEGAKVISEDNKHVGNLDQVLTSGNSGRATHFIVSQGMLLKERKLVPVDWIKDITQEALYLGVDAHTINRLSGYKD